MNDFSKAPVVEADVDRLLELALELGRLRSFRDPFAGAGVELTPPQVHAVLWLGIDGPLAHSVLAQRAGCSAPSCTGLVDRLVAMGVVERTRGDADRRVVLVQLTGKGEQLSALVRTFIRDRMESMLAALGDGDRQGLIGIIERLVTSFSDRRAREAASAEESFAAKNPSEDA